MGENDNSLDGGRVNRKRTTKVETENKRKF